MNSRERILRTMKREPVDRALVSTYELVGFNPDAFENRFPSYARLMDVIREKTDCFYMTYIAPKVSSRTEDSREWREWREGKSLFRELTLHTPLGDLRSLYRVDDDVMTSWALEHLLKDVEDIDKYLAAPYEVTDVDVEDVRKAVARLKGKHGIPLISISDPVCEVGTQFELAEFLVLAMTEREKIKCFLDACFERQINDLKMGLEKLKEVGETCMFRICGPEIATPPYLPEEYFRDFVFPYIKPMTELMHEYGHLVRLHCHGKTKTVLKYMVEAGCDATDPLEPPPDGDITLAEAKRDFGNDLVIFGNIELRLLETRPTQEVVDYVKDMMLVGKEGGGYCALPTAGPIDLCLRPLSEQNYLAFIETALEYGQY